jgi:hypothetical protein
LISGTTTLTGTTTATASATVATGTSVNFAVLVTGSDTPTAADTYTVTPTITAKPTMSKLAVSGLAPTASTLVNSTVVVTASTGVAAYTVATTAAANGRSLYTFTPDAAGTYTITYVTTASAGDTAGGDAVLTITATANTGTLSSISISNKAVASSDTAVAQTLTYTNGSATITAGGGTPFATAQIGSSVWTNDDGFIGTISAVTTAGGGTVATLAAAYTGTTRVANRFWLGALASTTVASGITANTITGMTVLAAATSGITINFDAGTVGTAATAKMSIGATIISSATTAVRLGDQTAHLSFTAPVAAGTYTATIAISNSGFTDATGADIITQPFTLTVTAASGLSTALSTAYMNSQGAAAASHTATTNAVARTGVRTAGTGLASIEVTLKNANGTAHSAGSTIRASITGSGYVRADVVATTAAGSIGTARSVSVDADAAGLAYVHVAADGTSGTGTVTVTVTNVATDEVTTLGTFTVTSYGPATKLEVSTSNYTIGRAGFTTGVASTTRAAATEIGNSANTTATITVISGTSTTPAFIVKATDAAGNVANLTNAATGNAAVPTVISDNVAVSGGGTCVLDGGAAGATAADAAVKSSVNGVGFYNCSFSIAPTAVSGGKATLTIRTPNPADTTTFLTATYAISVGGSVSTETIAFDKATYEPGEAMVVTRTAVDSAGNPVWDGAAAPAITFNKALGGSAIGASIYVGGKRATSATTPTVFAPVVTGAFTGRATSGNAAATALTATATVADDAATAAGSAAADAAAEATDAANAATDAANAAAEAADAATAAAQDAADAVAALSTSVTAMVDALKKQITSLTNLVIKIQKKVRA